MRSVEMRREILRSVSVTAVAIAAMAALAAPAVAAPKKPYPVVQRSASGTVIQPTTTIIHDGRGHTAYIVIPRSRSYLETVGDRHFLNYRRMVQSVYPPGGDPGRPNWFYGPDVQGSGGYPLPRPFYIPGLNPDLP